MWKRIRSFFGRKALDNSPQLGFDTMKSGVERILKLEFATDEAREAHGEQVHRVLKQLDAEIEIVRKRANGYPANPISADVWLSGAGYGNLARALTHHFRKAGWLKREENASALWAKASLAICSHYHHIVGPAMLANAECHDRLGDIDRSSQMYAGVVMDFAFLLDDLDDDADGPSDDDRVAIESLKVATERLVARGTTRLDTIDLDQIWSRAESVLSRFSSES